MIFKTSEKVKNTNIIYNSKYIAIGYIIILHLHKVDQ